MMSMKIAIYGSRRQHDAMPYISTFLAHLDARGAEVTMHPKLYATLTEARVAIPACVTPSETVPEDAALAVSIGGDGTFLRTAAWLGGAHVPVAGVNSGHLGFLTAIQADELPDFFDGIENNRFSVCSRSLIEVLSPQVRGSRYALNELAISKVDTASMINAAVTIDGQPLADYRADGLIICTPTGSTAYNLSVGGPIVHPSVEAMVISPVAAHSLTMRPMVVPSSSEIAIIPGGRAPHVRLSIDGRSETIDSRTEIVIRRAPFTLSILVHRGSNFADTLNRKLHWGEA